MIGRSRVLGAAVMALVVFIWLPLVVSKSSDTSVDWSGSARLRKLSTCFFTSACVPQ